MFKPFNAKQFLKDKLPEISRLNSLKNLATANAERRLIALKKKLESMVIKHPVSREVDEGPYAENSVAIISSHPEEGNIFSFVGFDSSDRPIDKLIDFLNSYIDIDNRMPRTRISRNKMVVNYSWDVSLPDNSDFDAEASLGYPDGYQSGSWISGIENGIIGINSYLFDSSRDFSTSRSGPAIQAKSKSGKLQNVGTRQQVRVPYMSKMIKEFARELKK